MVRLCISSIRILNSTQVYLFLLNLLILFCCFLIVVVDFYVSTCDFVLFAFSEGLLKVKFSQRSLLAQEFIDIWASLSDHMVGEQVRNDVPQLVFLIGNMACSTIGFAHGIYRYLSGIYEVSIRYLQLSLQNYVRVSIGIYRYLKISIQNYARVSIGIYRYLQITIGFVHGIYRYLSGIYQISIVFCVPALVI